LCGRPEPLLACGAAAREELPPDDTARGAGALCDALLRALWDTLLGALRTTAAGACETLADRCASRGATAREASTLRGW
jgi:hypothetical protein